MVANEEQAAMLSDSRVLTQNVFMCVALMGMGVMGCEPFIFSPGEGGIYKTWIELTVKDVSTLALLVPRGQDKELREGYARVEIEYGTLIDPPRIPEHVTTIFEFRLKRSSPSQN